VAIGTDAPFDMGEEAPLEKLAQARLTKAELEQISHYTAMDLVGKL
jgi:hypothetical protein